MAQTLEERAAAWQGLCRAQDDFVATLLRQCAGLEEELARTPATLESGTSISSDRESTKAAEAEQDAIRFEQERKLAELNDESSAYEAIISELRAEAQSRFAQVSQLSEAVSALTVTSARPPAPALPATTPPAFTLCLINGNAAPFADGPVSQGFSGGLDVAARLQWEIEKDIKNARPNVDCHSQEHPLDGGLLVFFFHDEDKSVARLVQRRAVAGVSTWQDFLGGFSSSANNQVVTSSAEDNVEDAMSALLTAFSENDSLKLVYLIGIRLDQLYYVCPPLSHDACSTKLSRKIVLVNASERDDDDELLQTSGWRVTKFNRFFSTSDLSFAEPDKPRSPSTSLSAAVSAAPSPIALAKKYIPGDRPVAASDGEDLTALYASLTTKTSKHKFDPAKRLLQQDPQMSGLQYVGVIGQDTHTFAVQLRLALLFKHRLHDGSWVRPQSQVQLDPEGAGRAWSGSGDDSVQGAAPYGTLIVAAGEGLALPLQPLRQRFPAPLFFHRVLVGALTADMLKDIFASVRPDVLQRDGRSPSSQPLLPSLVDSLPTHKTGPSRWTRVLLAVLGGYWLLWTAARTGVHQGVARTFNMALRYDSCGTAGLASRSPNDAHRIVFRVQPASTTGTSASLPDNIVLPQSLHPTLSAEHPLLFDGKARPLRVNSANASTCVDPISHTLPVLPRGVSNVAKAPELFFSVCTTPQRAETYAGLWQHFMAPKDGEAFRRGGEDPPSAAGCLVTDAQGQGDTAGHALANAEFSKQGLSCRMQDSSRVGRRYEERVLGLIRDAWAESERRKWQDGAAPVEWFVFHDDDTWFTDPDLLKDLLAEYDSRDDHFLGAFSESIGNFDMFGRISYGGAGMILSRSLVRKMQPLVDQCAERFGHIFGGDGLVSNCAALARNVPLEQVVEEIPAMRQMDLQGDASGYLTAGTAPFLTLHHWTGWLQLIPGIDGVAAIDLFRSTVNAVGGRNFLRRWVFDEGRVTWTVGHSIIVHRRALTPDALGRAEWTWQGHPSRQPSRPSLQEGEEKLTYLLTNVERLSPNVARLRHTCSHPSVQDGLREIDVLWDMRDPQAWWRARLPSGWKDVFPSSPRAGLQALTGGSLWRTDAELDEDDEVEDQIEMQPVPARKRRIEYTA